MFEEAQYFAPVAANEDGSVTVELARSHPGFADPVYRARRNAIAGHAVGYTAGEPIPHAEYTDEEHEVWTLVTRELAAKHRKYAIKEFLDAAEELGLPKDRIPQLEEVSELLKPLTGFRYLPAAGLVPLREFYGVLADSYFHSTQYIRHHSVPFYTPEPDVIHEVIGHGNTLASDRFAALYRLAGEAARRVETNEALEFVSKVFWFTLEFGVMREGRDLEGLRRRDPQLVRRDRGVPGHGHPAPGRDGDGDDRLRHHEIPGRPLRGGLVRPPRRRRRSVLGELR